MLPQGTEVVTRAVVIEESKQAVDTFISAFGTGLLVFAFITAFVSAFLINNVFQITIGQRLRELAMMRAIGAKGGQVRRLIYTEALVMSIVATIVGIAAGIGVAKLLIQVFNSAGAGFPSTATVLRPFTVVMAFVVGVGITMASVIIPARRAAKIPPVAAMRPELGFEALSAKRLVAGVVVTVVGVVAFVLGLFVRPGGTPGLIGLAGGGGLLIFLGVASVSSTVARPVTKLIGWPVAKLFKTPGTLARENAGRSPRRTSATAAALMIGVALVSAASVFASSIRETFTDALDRSVKADYIITDESFQGLPPTIAADAEPGAGGVGGDRGARHDGARRRRPEGVRRRRPAGVRAARRRRPEGGQLPGHGRRRHLRPAGPGQGPQARGRLARRGDVPERHQGDAAGGRHLSRTPRSPATG